MRLVRAVLTYGRFDVWHQGHVRFLSHLATLGREVIVGCASDEFARLIGQPCQFPFERRREMLERCRYVSRVIPQHSTAQKRTDIVNYDVCLLVMGTQFEGQFSHLQDIAQVRYLPRPPASHPPVFAAQLNKFHAAG